MQRPIIFAAAMVVTVIAGAAAYMASLPAPVYKSPALLNASGSTIGGPFELTTHEGNRVSSDALIDGPTLIYFGYTFCPDVCPIDTQVMADAVILLEERGIEVQPVFVTVDPERDDVEALASYVDGMHPRMMGLTGTKDEIKSAADAYKVYFSRQEMPGSAAHYLMSHTAYMYFVMPEVGTVGVFRNGFPPEQIATDIEGVLGTL
ncbi:MAG: SCO family protein [Pseudomonadota bacterium]